MRERESCHCDEREGGRETNSLDDIYKLEIIFERKERKKNRRQISFDGDYLFSLTLKKEKTVIDKLSKRNVFRACLTAISFVQSRQKMISISLM